MPNSSAISPAVTNKVLFNNESPSFLICGFRLYRLLPVLQLIPTAHAAMGLLFFEIPTIYRSAFLRWPLRGLGGSLLTDDTTHLLSLILLLMLYLYSIFAYILTPSIYFAKMLIFLFTIFRLSIIIREKAVNRR